jgi:hypothetical protein
MKFLFALFASAGVFGFLAWLVLLLGLVIGWVMNIIDIVHGLGGPITAMFVARLVGVFALPLGGVLGYF